MIALEEWSASGSSPLAARQSGATSESWKEINAEYSKKRIEWRSLWTKHLNKAPLRQRFGSTLGIRASSLAHASEGFQAQHGRVFFVK